MDEYISKEDLDAILKAKTNVEIATLQAEKATAAARILDLEYRMYIQQVYIKHGLSVEDIIEDKSGKIGRKNSRLIDAINTVANAVADAPPNITDKE